MDGGAPGAARVFVEALGTPPPWPAGRGILRRESSWRERISPSRWGACRLRCDEALVGAPQLVDGPQRCASSRASRTPPGLEVLCGRHLHVLVSRRASRLAGASFSQRCRHEARCGRCAPRAMRRSGRRRAPLGAPLGWRMPRAAVAVPPTRGCCVLPYGAAGSTDWPGPHARLVRGVQRALAGAVPLERPSATRAQAGTELLGALARPRPAESLAWRPFRRGRSCAAQDLVGTDGRFGHDRSLHDRTGPVNRPNARRAPCSGDQTTNPSRLCAPLHPDPPGYSTLVLPTGTGSNCEALGSVGVAQEDELAFLGSREVTAPGIRRCPLVRPRDRVSVASTTTSSRVVFRRRSSHSTVKVDLCARAGAVVEATSSPAPTDPPARSRARTSSPTSLRSAALRRGHRAAGESRRVAERLITFGPQSPRSPSSSERHRFCVEIGRSGTSFYAEPPGGARTNEVQTAL